MLPPINFRDLERQFDEIINCINSLKSQVDFLTYEKERLENFLKEKPVYKPLHIFYVNEDQTDRERLEILTHHLKESRPGEQWLVIPVTTPTRVDCIIYDKEVDREELNQKIFQLSTEVKDIIELDIIKVPKTVIESLEQEIKVNNV